MSDGTLPPSPFLDLPFTPRLPPLRHQAEFLRDHALDKAYGLFWEQGLGKTKALIDNAALLRHHGLIDGVFLLAPNSVHYNWAREELPKHWPLDAPPYEVFVWDTNKAVNKGFQREFAAFLDRTDPANGSLLGVFCMSYDSLVTEGGKAAAWAFLRRRKVLYIADESQRIKTPQTRGKNRVERTAVVTDSSVYAEYLRLASGTPADEPLDMYSQIRFLSPRFWSEQLGIDGIAAFRSHFAEIVNIPLAGGRSFPKLKGYRRLDEMAQVVKKISSRVLKKDALDLPPKTYKRAFHEMTPAQARAYRELRQDAMTQLEGGEVVSVGMAITLRLRFAQIAAGHLGGLETSRPGEVHAFDPNPREALLKELLRDLTSPVIVWHRFIPDVGPIVRAAEAAGRRVAVFDGSRPGDSLDVFHRGEVDTLVGNLSSGLIEGHTLTEAKAAIYFSRDRKLIARAQSEDRNHRIGQDSPVEYFDLLADGTLDEADLAALRAKRRNAAAALGDDPDDAAGWLEASDSAEALRRDLEDLRP